MKRRKKGFNWALYESLRQIEREEAFRLLKRAVDSLPPPWDSRWKGIGRKPHDARALTVVTIWQEIEGKAERAYTADLERDGVHLRLLRLEHAPHRTALYRTRRRLSEDYMRRLNQRILEGLKAPRRLGADATGLRQSRRDCACPQPARRAAGIREAPRPLQPGERGYGGRGGHQWKGA
jgi:hypothetical protein